MTIINYILNNINNNKINNINEIPNITNSMLTKQKKELIDNVNKKHIIKEEVSNNKIEFTFKTENKKTTEELVIENYYLPKQKDSLFWCIYIFKYGMNKYNEISNYGNTELKEKQNCIKFIEKNKNLLKTTNYKITNINIQEIKSELMTEQTKTSYYVLLAFVFYYNINIYIIHENRNMYLSFKNDTNTINHVIFKDKNKYRIQKMNVNNLEIDNITRGMYCLVHFNKPIKGLSTYKVSDLHDIARILNIENYTNYKKNELYELIQLKLIWEGEVR